MFCIQCCTRSNFHCCGIAMNGLPRQFPVLQTTLQHNHHVLFAPIFNKREEIYLNRPTFFPSASETLAADGYSRLLPKKTRTIRDRGRERRYTAHTIRWTGKYPIHSSSYTGPKLKKLLRQTRQGRRTGQAELTRRRTKLQNKPERSPSQRRQPVCRRKKCPTRGVRNRLRYVVRWYVYGKTDDSFEPSHHIQEHLIDACLRQFEKRSKRIACLGANDQPGIVPAHNSETSALHHRSTYRSTLTTNYQKPLLTWLWTRTDTIANKAHTMWYS